MGNYLASPPLVVAYAIAGTTDIDLRNDALGKDRDGNDVFLKDNEAEICTKEYLSRDNVLLNSGSASAASSRLKVTRQRCSKTGVMLAAMAFYLYWWFLYLYCAAHPFPYWECVDVCKS